MLSTTSKGAYKGHIMKKIIISIAVAIVILIAAVFAVITINNHSKQNDGGEQIYENIEDAAKNASFYLKYPDRLCGYPATVFRSNSSMIEVKYGDTNYIRKTLGVMDNSGNKTKYNENIEQRINGITVTFKGEDGLYYLAVWNDNNFAYTISVTTGVTIDEMTEYIEATR